MMNIEPAAGQDIINKYIEKALPGSRLPAFGTEKPLWAALTEDGDAFAVTAASSEGVLHINRGGADLGPHAAIIAEKGIRHISGDAESIRAIKPLLPDAEEGRSILMAASAVKDVQTEMHVRLAGTREDIGRIYDLLASLDEYRMILGEKGTWVNEQTAAVHDGRMLICFAEKGGVPFSTASLAGLRSADAAMLVNTGTAKDMRRMGAASAVICRICREAFSAGKSVYLFCASPEAEALYLSLGFSRIADWCVLDIL